MSEVPSAGVTGVDREVILDLLPLVMAGEASPASRALVDAWLAHDPDLARRVAAGGAVALPHAGAAPRPEVELRALIRTRRLLALQRWLFGFAIAFTSIALATRIAFENGHLRQVRLLIFDYPRPLGTCLALGLGCWIAYRAVRRRLRATSL